MAGLDKCAKRLRDQYDIAYTQGLRVKAQVLADPDFDTKWAEAKAQGTSFVGFVAQLAGPIIEREFEEVPEPESGS